MSADPKPDASRIGALLAAAEVGVRVALPWLKTVNTVRGPVTGEEIRRLAVRAPAVLFACAGARDVCPEDGGVRCELSLAAFAVAADQASGGGRAELAQAAAEGLLRWLPTWHPGAGVPSDPPSGIEGGNLYSGKIDKLGIAIWLVRWKQVIRIPAADPETPWVPRELHWELDEAPRERLDA